MTLRYVIFLKLYVHETNVQYGTGKTTPFQTIMSKTSLMITYQVVKIISAYVFFFRVVSHELVSYFSLHANMDSGYSFIPGIFKIIIIIAKDMVPLR